MRIRLAAALALGATLALSACGLGAGEARPGGVELRVTRDFGERLLDSVRRERLRPGDTVLRLLGSEAKVKTAYGGGFVQTIDGLEGRGSGGRHDWFYFVNGLESSVGAAERELAPGDVVQWDYRRWDSAMSVPAIVGAFPEPLVSGTEARRLPVRLECAQERSRACGEAERRLAAAGVTAPRAPFGKPGAETVVRVIVAPWSVARNGEAAAQLERGPTSSGVFARFADRGRRLELLDPSGRRVREAPPGTGLVAATSLGERGRVWLVTGADYAGVERAARALERAKLRDRYAIAALPSGVVALPLAKNERSTR